MGKPIGKKKPEVSTPWKATKAFDRNLKAFDEDTAIFITMSQELKEEGNKLFQRHDHEGAMLKYEKALKLLPSTHIDVANLRTHMASCYMQMGIGEYPRAINECNLALEVAPKYSKALLRRAKCFEGLNRLDLAWRDVNVVLSMEPNNQTALEMSEGLKKLMEENGMKVDEIEVPMTPEQSHPPSPSSSSSSRRNVKHKSSSKKKRRSVNKLQSSPANARSEDTPSEQAEEEKEKEKGLVDEPKLEQVVKPKPKRVHKRKAVENKPKPRALPVIEDKEVVQEKVSVREEKKAVARTVKLVFGDDIRCAQLPINCSVLLMMDVVRDRFPTLEGALVKYRDQEGDLVTITTTDELRRAENLADNSHGSLRLYVSEITPDQEPAYDGVESSVYNQKNEKKLENGGVVSEKDSTRIDSWIVQFAELFKAHVGFELDSYLDLHGVGMKIYTEAIEDTVSSEDAQELLDIASDKFQEMSALALFNMGNVHMSKARKHDVSEEEESEMDEHLKSAYEWAKEQYTKAGLRYEDAIKTKPDFFEAYIALGQQQFEQAMLTWHYSQASKTDDTMDPHVTQEILILYNMAEESMEKGMQIWEESEERRLNGLCKEEKYKAKLQKTGLGHLVKDLSAEEAAEQVSMMKSQMYILWGTLLYERSVIEFKLGLPSWEECLEVAVEKFELAGASRTDITVMIKNHCSNQTAPAGLGFKIDEIVQAWHEMYDAKRWQIGIQSFRLEPLFRRRVPRLHHVLEHL